MGCTFFGSNIPFWGVVRRFTLVEQLPADFHRGNLERFLNVHRAGNAQLIVPFKPPKTRRKTQKLINYATQH
ncbi:MAG: hypothetical protein QXR19_16010 [Candidatus Jordarchaeaceae archaeon]